MNKLLVSTLFLLTIIAGCSSMTTSEQSQKRSELDAMATKAIAGLIEQDSAIQAEIDQSLGYAVANMKLTKVPIVGGGGGEGVFVNQKTQQRVYITFGRFDFGGGWGARSYKALLIVKSQKIMDKLKGGTWIFEAGAEVSAGTAAAEGATGNDGFTMHVLADGGASATVTARVIKVSANKSLME